MPSTIRSVVDVHHGLENHNDLAGIPDDTFDVLESLFYKAALKRAVSFLYQEGIVPVTATLLYDLKRCGLFDKWLLSYFDATSSGWWPCMTCRVRCSGEACERCARSRPAPGAHWLAKVSWNANTDAELRRNMNSQMNRDVEDMRRKPLQPIMLGINRAIKELGLARVKLDGSNAFYSPAFSDARPATGADFDRVREMVDVIALAKGSKKGRNEFVVAAFADLGVVAKTWEVAQLIQDLFDRGLHNPWAFEE
jgi:hypothetical protein